MESRNKVVGSIDWFRCTMPDVTDIAEFVEELEKIDNSFGIENFEYFGTSLFNYEIRYNNKTCPSFCFAYNPIDDGDENCFIAKNKDICNNPGIVLSLSGDACRYIGSENLKKVLLLCFKRGCHVTRIDLAMDFYNKDNDIVPLLSNCFEHFLYYEKGDYTIKTNMHRKPKNFKKYTNIYPETGEVTENYVIGHHGSCLGMFRMYDKLYELRYGRLNKYSEQLIGDKEYWYRCELELHNEHCNRVFNQLVVGNNSVEAAFADEMPHVFTPVLGNYNRVSDHSEIVVLWAEWLEELAKDIHFVQLVKDEYVDSRPSDTFKYFDRMSKSIAIAYYFLERCPGIFYDIRCRGENKLQTQPSAKYSWLDDFLKMPYETDEDKLKIYKKLTGIEKDAVNI